MRTEGHRFTSHAVRPGLARQGSKTNLNLKRRKRKLIEELHAVRWYHESTIHMASFRRVLGKPLVQVCRLAASPWCSVYRRRRHRSRPVFFPSLHFPSLPARSRAVVHALSPPPPSPSTSQRRVDLHQKIDMLSEVSTEAMDIVQVNLEGIQSSKDFEVRS